MAGGSMSGFWDAPLKGRTILKAGIILLGLLVVAVVVLWAFMSFSMRPPKEKKLISNFQTHLASYERLRDMLLADQQVEAVYVSSGVLTTKSGLPHKPAEVNFSVSRYNEYVALLEKVGSNAAFRTEGNDPELVCVGAWGAGWAGDTRHVWVCSTDHEPANRISDLDDYYRDPKRPHNVYMHIEGNWYLRADW
jgi:hypothetical protein